jgi:hypothetical protein
MKISISNFYPLYILKMKKLLIIYWKNRNYKWIDFMDYSLIEKNNSENLMIKWYDFMYIWKTKKETKEIFNNRLEFQKQKIENSGYDYRNVIHELKYSK